MTGRSYGALDAFRLLAALLVVAIHTGPLASFSTDADFLLCRALGRVAVPFFFTVTGFFLLPRLEQSGRCALAPFWKKGLRLYAAALALYLPVLLYTGYFRQAGLPAVLLRDLVFDGPVYHLWYLPALLLGMAIAAALVSLCPRAALPVGALLYLFGLLGDSYYGLGLFPEGLFALFGYTRNGLFFAPLFLLLGWTLAKHPARCAGGRRVLGGKGGNQRAVLCYGAALAGMLVLLCGEALLVRRLALARHDSMYVLLPGCLWALMRLLCTPACPSRPALRRLSTAVYLVHPLCIIGVRGAAKALGVFDAVTGNSLLFYGCVCLPSLALAGLWVKIRRRFF